MAKHLVFVEVETPNAPEAINKVMDLIRNGSNPTAFAITTAVCSEQAQDSTHAQLIRLIPIANKVGLFDAGDYLQNRVLEGRDI